MPLKVYTISPNIPFLPELAAGIFEMAGGMGPDLTRFRILLPTRRAVRELHQEFLRLSNGIPLLLPRMHPLGDIDQEELDLLISGTIESENIDSFPPALSSLERQMMLTTLIQRKDPSLRGDHCLSLARALGRLLDQVYTEDLDFASLPTLVDNGDLSRHWTQTIEFLKILSEVWPQILAVEGKIDSADRRNRLLKMLAAFWSSHPPQTPVIAAGSTGSIPATGNLLHTIAGLPHGHVILPGIDLAMEEESWEKIGETHPQNTMKRLIERMDIPRRHIKFWGNSEDSPFARLHIARAITCPADTCDSFDIAKDTLEKGLENVALLEADNTRHEGQLIALAVRECLEIPDKRAVIITPDRNLARRISASLKRWDIQCDDSAGQALHMKPAGIFIGRILACITENFAPLALLDILKTPYALRHFGAAAVSEMEIRILRGPRPSPGLEGLQSHIGKMENPENLIDFITRLETAFSPLLSLSVQPHTLPVLIKALVQTAENLAGGAENLWKGDDGEALSALLCDLQSSEPLLDATDIETHRGYLLQFMSECKVRPAYGTHPRVTILGQIEARLIPADLMICAGLNEGTWPPEPDADPWMSRPMRKRFGLPPIERQTGLSAHDFVQAFNAPRVLLIRSRKAEGTLTVPTRWLERLGALLEKEKLSKDILAPKSDYISWLAQLNTPSVVTPILIPEPSPPLAFRPTRLSITGIETLMRNPYETYARHVLKLIPLRPIDEDITAADRGEFIHDLLNEFVSAYPVGLPENSEDILLALGREKLATLEQISPNWHYWWPRFENLVPAYIAHERLWRENAKPWQREVQGACDFIFNGTAFTLYGRADRIDIQGDGGAIIDYKTGNTPKPRDVAKGKSPQLPLEAILVTRGAFGNEPLKADQISLNYWTLTGGKTAFAATDLSQKKIRIDGQDKPIVISDLIDQAEEGLKLLMTAFLSDVTPCNPVIPTGNRLYDKEKSYLHLSRGKEWGIAGEEDQKEDAA